MIKSLIEDIHQVQEDVEGHRVILENGIKELSGKLFDENHIFLSASELSQIYKEAIMKQVEDENSSKTSMYAICDIRISLDNLKTHLDRCKKIHSSARRSITRFHTIVDYIVVPDEAFVLETKKRYEDFSAQCKEP